MSDSGTSPNALNLQAGAQKLSKPDCFIAFLIFCAMMAQAAHTIHQVGVSWDEPYYFLEAKQYFSWFENLGSGGSFQPETIRNVFGFRIELDNHPTMFKLLGALSYACLRDLMGGFWAYRMSAVILLGSLLALVFVRATLSWGRLAGIGAVLCTGLTPSLFTHGHIGATEMPLCFFWFLTVWACEAGTRRKAMIPLAGVCFGLLMSAKFTGWLAPFPLLLWAVIYGRKNVLLLALSLFLVGPAVFYLLQPDMWLHPLSYLRAFWEMSVTRNEWTPISVLLLNRIYPAYGPWYYAPFMLLVTVPAAILALFLAGTIRFAVGRGNDSFAALCLINFLFIIAATFVPNAPKYDSVRLFLPAVMFLSVLAGSGFDAIVRLAGRLAGSRKQLSAIRMAAAALVIAAAVAAPLMNVYPFGLEYYNELIGGVQGARERGMETAYWWTVLNGDAFKEINGVLPRGAALGFHPMNQYQPELYVELGLLRKDIIVKDSQDAEYVVILSRPYWDFAGNYSRAGINPIRPRIVAHRDLDGVPLWVLYRTR
jgi:4-amino-4-deoxy-L-arabinose transferase-like glycosyltransferase